MRPPQRPSKPKGPLKPPQGGWAKVRTAFGKTRRAREIVRRILFEGKTNAQVAKEMGIAEYLVPDALSAYLQREVEQGRMTWEDVENFRIGRHKRATKKGAAERARKSRETKVRESAAAVLEAGTIRQRMKQIVEDSARLSLSPTIFKGDTVVLTGKPEAVYSLAETLATELGLKKGRTMQKGQPVDYSNLGSVDYRALRDPVNYSVRHPSGIFAEKSVYSAPLKGGGSVIVVVDKRQPKGFASRPRSDEFEPGKRVLEYTISIEIKTE